MSNPILDSDNKPVAVSGLLGAQLPDSKTLSGLPLGKTPAGEVIVKTASAGANFQLPTFDNLAITYVGATNNINTVVYKVGTTVVGTLTLAYVGGVPAADDAKISTATLTLP